MIANISYSTSAAGALIYNETKVAEGTAVRLGDNNIFSTDIFAKAALIESYSRQNRVNETVFHTSLSLSTADRTVSDEEFKEIADSYMKKMGYSELPYTVYRHNDTAHQHIHIIASRFDEDSKLVNQRYEFKKSRSITEKLETEHELLTWEESKELVEAVSEKYNDKQLLATHGAKTYVAKITKQLKTNSNFTNFNQYKQLLQEKHIQVKEYPQPDGTTGLVYFVKDETGKEYKPIKASAIYHDCMHKAIEQIAEKNAANRKAPDKLILKRFEEFNQQIKIFSTNTEQNKSLQFIPILHTDNSNNIYGVSFMDATNSNIYKASELLTNYNKQNLISRFEANGSINENYITNGKIGKAYHQLKHNSEIAKHSEVAFLSTLQPKDIFIALEKDGVIPQHYCSNLQTEIIENKIASYIQQQTTIVEERQAKKDNENDIKNDVLKNIFSIDNAQGIDRNTLNQMKANYITTNAERLSYLPQFFEKNKSTLWPINKLVQDFTKLPLLERTDSVRQTLINDINALDLNPKGTRTNIVDLYKQIAIASIKDGGVELIADNKPKLAQYINAQIAKIYSGPDLEKRRTIQDNVIAAMLRNPEHSKELIYASTTNKDLSKIATEKNLAFLFATLTSRDMTMSDKQFNAKYSNIIAQLPSTVSSEVRTEQKIKTIEHHSFKFFNKQIYQLNNKLPLTKRSMFNTSQDYFSGLNPNSKNILAEKINKIIADNTNYNPSEFTKEQLMSIVDKYALQLEKSLPKLFLNEQTQRAINPLYKQFVAANKLDLKSEINSLPKFKSYILQPANFDTIKSVITQSYNSKYPKAPIGADEIIKQINRYIELKEAQLNKFNPKQDQEQGLTTGNSTEAGYRAAKGVKKGDWTKGR